jgi:hypothetical protein
VKNWEKKRYDAGSRCSEIGKIGKIGKLGK